MCKQVSPYQSCCYLLHTNCSAPQNPISKRLEEGTVCRNTAIEISALITLTLKKEMMLDDSWHPKPTFTFVALIGIGPALPWDCFLLFFPACVLGGVGRKQLSRLWAWEVCSAPWPCSTTITSCFPLKSLENRLGNTLAGERTQLLPPMGCRHGEDEDVCSVYNVLSLFPGPACGQMLQLSRGGAEPSPWPLALGKKERSTGNALGWTPWLGCCR